MEDTKLDLPDINEAESNLEKIMEFDPEEETIQFREWNDEMLEWLIDYKAHLLESYEKGNINENKYKDQLSQIKEMIKNFIDEDYIDKLIAKVQKMNVSFVNSEQDLDRKSYKFDEYVRVTSMRMGGNPQIFFSIIDLTVKKFAESEEEIKAFKSILYKLTQQSNLINESHQTEFKFLHLFMKSMHGYSLPLFNEIAKKYLEAKEGETN